MRQRWSSESSGHRVSPFMRMVATTAGLAAAPAAFAAGAVFAPDATTLESIKTRNGPSGRLWYLSHVALSTGTLQPWQQVSSHAEPMQRKRSAYAGRPGDLAGIAEVGAK